MATWTWFHRWSSPKWFYEKSERWLPWLFTIAGVLLAYGLVNGLYFSPPDYQQGHSVRIMYLHVPSAFLSMSIYVIMAVCAAVGYIWRIKLAHAAAAAAAPIGAAFTFLALFTGSVWGKPTWNTYWVWDARITTELILFFLYVGFIALRHAFDDQQTGDRAAGILAMVGVINVPIIHFSVYWWHTLHQGATISRFGKPKMDPNMLEALLVMIAAYYVLFIAIFFLRLRNELLWRERQASWVRELAK